MAQKEKEYKEIQLPIIKKRKFLFFKEKTLSHEEEDKTEENKPETPVAFIIKANNEGEVLEGIDGKELIIPRKTGKNKTRDVHIPTPKSKIISFKWGNEVLKAFIIDEQEGMPLPTQIHHDSLEFERICTKIILDYKDYNESKGKLEGWGTLILYTGIGLAILVGAIAIGTSYMHMDLMTAIFGKQATTMTTKATDTNSLEPFIGLIKLSGNYIQMKMAGI